MAYFWLNQKSDEDSNYYDDIGETYHYRGNTPGAQQIDEGDRFVYYRPGHFELFGAGTIEKIEKETDDSGFDSGVHVDYFAHISDYQAFEPPVVLKGLNSHEVKEKISFLKNRPGLTGVPQHSIHKISQKDFDVILEAADEVSTTGSIKG